LPAYDPDAYDSFESYLQALQRAYRGLETPTAQEREYLQAWEAFVKATQGAGLGESELEPPLSGILPYVPDTESREQYISYALAQTNLQEPAHRLPYGACLNEGERRELARLALEGYCRAVEAQAKRKGVRLRREQGRELGWEDALQRAELLYLRLHRGWSWGQLQAYASKGRAERVSLRTVRSWVQRAMETLQIASEKYAH